METARTGSLMDRPDSVNADHVDDSVLQISGVGHWFLERWIGDQFLGLGIIGSSYVRLSVPDTGPRRSTGGSVEPRYGWQTLAKIRLWSSRSRRWTWWHRYQPYSPLQNLYVDLHAVAIRSQYTYMICWTRRLGIWTAHSNVN